MKNNQFLIDLGDINLTNPQRKLLHTTIHRAVVKKLKTKKVISVNLKKGNQPKTQMIIATRDMQGDELSTDILSNNADVTITFLGGIGKLSVTLNNDNEKIVTRSSTVTFKNTVKGDIIGVDGNSNGGVKIEIDVKTKPTTPVTCPDGNVDEDFVII